MAEWEMVDRVIQEAQQHIREKAEGDYAKLVQNLQHQVAESGRPISSVARMAAVGDNTIRAFLSGRSDMGIKKVLLICRALEISLRDLIP